MYAIDGNNSLKRMIKHGDRDVADRRVFEDSDYYLSNDFVNTFAKQVKPRPPPEDDDVIEEDPSATDSLDDLPTDLPNPPDDGDPTDGAPPQDMVRICVKNWKSAAAEENKKMWSIFDETGIFAGACRHGLILWLIDMIRSGEL